MHELFHRVVVASICYLILLILRQLLADAVRRGARKYLLQTLQKTNCSVDELCRHTSRRVLQQTYVQELLLELERQGLVDSYGVKDHKTLRTTVWYYLTDQGRQALKNHA